MYELNEANNFDIFLVSNYNMNFAADNRLFWIIYKY